MDSVNGIDLVLFVGLVLSLAWALWERRERLQLVRSQEDTDNRVLQLLSGGLEAERRRYRL